jgi:flagellar biosynthesis chaperone FliJ
MTEDMMMGERDIERELEKAQKKIKTLGAQIKQLRQENNNLINQILHLKTYYKEYERSNERP